MKVINFFVENWDIILLAIAAIASVVIAVFRGNKSVVMKLLYSLVIEAEKEFGAGTGTLKLADVVSKVYPKLPVIIKTFVTDKRLTNWIEQALAAAKETWRKNAAIAGYIEDTKETKQN